MLDSLLKQVQSMKNPFAAKGPALPASLDPFLVTHAAHPSLLVEQYRNLCEDLLAITASNRAKVIEVTSSGPGDGKTIVSCNMALTLAATDKKVLLIDCDLRRPDIHTVFGVPQAPGFSDAVTGAVEVTETLRTPSGSKLCVITAGTTVANVADVLRQEKARQIVSVLKDVFDFIIIDTPPILPVSDSRIMATWCDAVILAVKADATAKTALDEAISLLEHTHIKPAGFVLVNYQIPVYDFAKRKYRSEDYVTQT